MPKVQTAEVSEVQNEDQSQGRCTWSECNEPFAEGHKSLCVKHRDEHNAYKLDEYITSQFYGQCTRGGCTEPLAEGHKSLCPKHRDKHNAYIRNCIARSQLQGQCTRGGCTEPLAEGNRWYCLTHRDQINAHSRHKRREAKVIRLCSNCREEEINSQNKMGICSKRKKCRKAVYRKRAAIKQARGECTQGSCTQPIAKDRSKWYCAEHLDKHTARQLRYLARTRSS